MAFVQATSRRRRFAIEHLAYSRRAPVLWGTYLPPPTATVARDPENILKQIARLWRDDRERVETESKRILDALSAAGEAVLPSIQRRRGTLAARFRDVFRSFDEEHGGFGGAPNSPALR